MPTGEEFSSVTDTEADQMEEHLHGLGYPEFSASNVVFGRCSGGRSTRFARKAYDKLGLYGKTMGVASAPRVLRARAMDGWR